VTSAAADDHVPVEHVVSLLRERLYGAVSCLATLAVLFRYTDGDTSALARILDVVVATGGLLAASLLAEWLAHLGVHGRAPHGGKAVRMLQSSGQIVEAALLPLVVVVVAAFGVIRTYTATWIAMWILVAELGIIAMLAVRRTRLPWWQKLFTVGGLVGVGVVVIGVKILAH
jgi:hypothetical protein